MTIKTILVHTEHAQISANRLECAGALADEFGATVLGLGAEAIPPIYIGGGAEQGVFPAELAISLREQISANLAASEAVFDQFIGARPKLWRTSWLEPTRAVATEARAADLIIVGGSDRRAEADLYRSVDVAALVVTAGRPVLVCPKGQNHLAKGPVIVAWKDTRESRRAVADALPLLERATDVAIVEICDDAEAGGMTSGADVADALRRHGVFARSERIVRKGSTSQCLLERADRGGALIVAGGYGHSRMGEWAFGGVTRALLAQDNHFVLLSH